MLLPILLRQIAIMALLVAVGWVLRRKEFLTEQGTKDLGALLLRERRAAEDWRAEYQQAETARQVAEAKLEELGEGDR